MSKYTKEPWALGRSSKCVISENSNGLTMNGATGKSAINYYGGNLIAESVEPSNATRIVQCINAMEGIENPAEYMKTMREVHDTLATTREKLEITMTELKILSLLIMRISNNTQDIAILNDINETLEGLKR